jgi:hypothetical protein
MAGVDPDSHQAHQEDEGKRAGEQLGHARALTMEAVSESPTPRL